jgi:hypothetical protein
VAVSAPPGDAVNVKEVRRFALALPQVSEEPHFHLSSFRVHGKIFATLAPDGTFLNVFVDDEQRELMVAVDPKVYETLWWGKKVVGLHVHVTPAKSSHVEQLLRSAWERKAPKKLLREQAG